MAFCVDLIGDTENVEEAANLFTGVNTTDTPFQSIQQLLAGDGLQAGSVTEGMDGHSRQIVQLAGDSLVADAAPFMMATSTSSPCRQTGSTAHQLQNRHIEQK